MARILLRRLQRKLGGALDSPRLRKMVSALLARRLPGPLGVLVKGLGDAEQRGFRFWWLMGTLAVGVALALLLGIVLAPVTAIAGLLAWAIWTLIKKGRQPAARSA